MRILIIGEGPNDLGDGRLDESGHLEGALPRLVGRLLEEAIGYLPVFETIQWKGIRTHTGSGFDKKLKAVLGLPQGRKAEGIVGVVDRDGEANTSKIHQLNNGRDEVLKANKRCAVGQAIEKIEAWLLADEVALRQTLGDPRIQTQPHPEQLSAKDEQSENNPKRRLRRLINAAAEFREHDYTGFYAGIAARANLNHVCERCPKGFGPFATQVRSLAGSSSR